MKKLFFALFITVCGLGVLSACKPQETQQIMPSPENTSTSLPSKTPNTTNTPKPISTPTPTPIATTFACSKSRIPAELLSIQPNTETNKKVAFVRSGTYYSGDDESDVYVMNLDGSNLINISKKSGGDSDPSWSPDGKKIAFLSLRNSPIKSSCFGPSSDCVPELFLANPDGSGLRQITKGITYSPTWSPDGKQIAFIHYFNVDPSLSPASGQNESMLSDIYLVNPDGSNMRNLTNKPSIYKNVVWSPDGEYLAFILLWPTNEMGVISADGTNISIYPDVPVQEVLWTNDGKNLIFTNYDQESYKINVDFTSTNKLISIANTLGSLIAFSHDGKWLIHYLIDTEHHCNQIRALDMESFQDYFIYDINDVESLVEKPSGLLLHPSSMGITSISLSPNGNQVIFSQMIRFDGVIAEQERIFMINFDGTNLLQIEKHDEISEFAPQYNITSPSIQP